MRLNNVLPQEALVSWKIHENKIAQSRQHGGSFDTFMGRKLKVVFVLLADGTIAVKTAYEPDKDEIRIYHKYAEAL